MVIPGEDGAMEVWASTQNPTKTQNFCAYVCGVPANQVTSLDPYSTPDLRDPVVTDVDSPRRWNP